MKRKTYISPMAFATRLLPIQMLTVSIIEDGIADPDADILVRRNDWDFWEDDADAESNGSADLLP